MLVRLSSDIVRRRMVAGASTLTMQLARGLFADEIGFTLGDKSPERKIKEILVAIQIEKRYTKRDILTFYCNQVHLGHGTYGVEAAARMYFGKRAKDVTHRGSGDDGRHHPDALAAEPLRQSCGCEVQTGLHAAGNGRERLHHAGAGRRIEEEADRHARPAAAGAIGRAVFHRRGPQVSRAEVRRQDALRSRVVGSHRHRYSTSARGEPCGRSRAPGRRQAPRLSPRQAESHVPRGRMSKPIATSAGVSRSRRTISSRQWWQMCLRLPRGFASASRWSSSRPDAFAWTRRAPPALFKVGDLIDIRVAKVDDVRDDRVGLTRAVTAGRRRPRRH